LENGDFLTINSTNKFSIVAVLNWQLYQDNDHEFDQQMTNKRPTDDQQVTTNKNVKNVMNDKNEKKKEIYVGLPPDDPGASESIPFSDIIDHLNKTCGSKFKASSEKTKSLIRARWREGNRIEDFKTVIDKKTAEWASNTSMCQYLRPETLFGTKFESYLNQPWPKGKGCADEKSSSTRSFSDDDWLVE
jgi:uncharacterized phage protein (TIGR02220 family)